MNKAIFKENIKRFWPISFAAFIAYFMSGPFYLLQANPESSYGVLSSAVSTSNIGYAFVTCLLGIAVGAAVYAYLFKGNSTVFMHAAPVSRLQLFTSSACSGLTLAFIPVVANTLVLLALKLSGKFDIYFACGSEFRAVEMWSVISILGWMLVVFVELFFILSICTLSAMISGSPVINVLTSIALNLLTTLVYLSAIAYGNCFVFGLTDSSWVEDTMCKLHPILNYGVSRLIFGNDEIIVNDLSLIVYILVAAAIYAASYWIYTKRANERTGDSYVFDIVNVIICVLMVYMGASCIGLIFQDGIGYWGFVIGGVFTFFVGQLIIQKSFRIFNRKLLISFAASFIVMALVIAGFAVDLFGIEKYVPKAGDVSFVTVWDSGVYGGYNDIKDPENIARLTEFQKEIVSHKDEILELQRLTEEDGNDYEEFTWFEMTYHLNDGKQLERSYSVPESLLDGSEDLKALYSSREILSVFDTLKSAKPEDTKISVYLDTYYDGGDIAYDGYYEFKNPYADKYGKAFGEAYNEYYGMTDLTDDEKIALMQAFCSDLERIGLRRIDAYGDPSYFSVEIEIAHPMAASSSVIEQDNNFHSYWYTYDGDVKTGIVEDFSFVVLEGYDATLAVLEEILANHLE